MGLLFAFMFFMLLTAVRTGIVRAVKRYGVARPAARRYDDLDD
jgi:hypothetical protein